MKEHFDITDTDVHQHAYVIDMLSRKLGVYKIQLSLYQDLIYTCKQWIQRGQWVEHHTSRAEEHRKKVEEYSCKCQEISNAIEALKKGGN